MPGNALPWEQGAAQTIVRLRQRSAARPRKRFRSCPGRATPVPGALSSERDLASRSRDRGARGRAKKRTASAPAERARVAFRSCSRASSSLWSSSWRYPRSCPSTYSCAAWSGDCRRISRSFRAWREWSRSGLWSWQIRTWGWGGKKKSKQCPGHCLSKGILSQQRIRH